MKAFTFDEIRDGVYTALKGIFPHYEILDLGSHMAFRGREFTEIELPVVTYSLSFRPNYARVVDEHTEKDVEKSVVTIEELIPYDVTLLVGVHSDLVQEAEAMALAVQRAWGYAPCVAGIGFHLTSLSYGGAFDLTGVASFQLQYVGWVRLPGPKTEAIPMIREVQMNLNAPKED